ncbi:MULTISPECIES: GMC family oxidoreductase N-terminal domain-containing protein [unclassified Beijerinckia]|uniref:GMC family oxidoreductase n=1 Tax=unclassified Beijerinckia TaxID=2638183 RepID=UPI00089C359C|nr:MULTISPECIES: GMC family oxidoreductase N-terminal domain-containing protein [unclassified Beijerinckia]MDH7795989.1 choline dehydrogenase [Beijerinckia sp. GAS462]SEC25268.1 Choline dehydrogenase [Beijerinckia sp. 28-YEA-48]
MFQEYDYIVVGGGSSGCVVANRLSADPKVTVCLLEAGPSDRHGVVAFKSRLPVGTVMLLPHARYNWGYFFTGDAGLAGRSIASHRGRLSGGSSSVNGMLYMRGHPRDYDEWAEQGNPGWRWSDVLPTFIKQENREKGANELHGAGGELNVAPLRTLNSLTRAFLAAAEETQYPRNDDFNGVSQDGFGPWEVTQKNGQRWNSARAFLHPIAKRPNLTVSFDTEILRIELTERRATGVIIRRDGQEMRLGARREVVLTAGAYNSPKLLMISGIGDAAELKKVGIEPVHHLPGVGRNLQDHPTAWVEYEDISGKSAALNAKTIPRYAAAVFSYVFARRGPLTSNGVEAGGFLRTRSNFDRPDVQYVFMPARRAPGQFLPREHGFTLMPILLRPQSRGSVSLVSSRPEDKPKLEPNFLDNAVDVDTMVRGTLLARQLVEASAFAPFRGRELNPGREVQSHRDMEDFLRSTITTAYHPVGTCKMAPASDPNAVVDEKLRVRGIEGLRIADVSIMPTIIGGNTNAPAMMIGERAAGFAMSEK